MLKHLLPALALSVVLTPFAVAQDDPLPKHAVKRIGSLRGRHSDLVLWAAFPSNKTLLTFGADYRACLWDVATGQLLSKMETCELLVPRRAPFVIYGSGEAVPVALALSADGQTLVTCTASYEACFWAVTSGKPAESLKDVPRSCVAFAFSADSKWFAALDRFGDVHLWDWALKKKVITPAKPGTDAVAGTLSFAPDGKMLAVSVMKLEGPNSFQARLATWAVTSGKEIASVALPEVRYPAMLPRAVFAADSKMLFFPVERDLFAVNPMTGKVIWQSKVKLGVHADLVLAADGKTLHGRLADGSAIGSWRIEDGDEIPPLCAVSRPRSLFSDHWPAPSSFALSPDGRLLATVGDGFTAHLYDTQTGKETGWSGGLLYPAYGLAYTPDGRQLRAWTGDQRVFLWDSPDYPLALEWKHTGGTCFFSVTPDGRVAAVSRVNQSIDLLDTKDQRPLNHIDCPPKGNTISEFSPNGKTLAVWTGKTWPRLYDVATGHVRGELVPAKYGALAPDGILDQVREPLMVFSADSSLVAAVVHQRVVVIADTATGQRVAEILLPAKMHWYAAAFSPDSCTFALDLGAGEVGVWEVATGQLRLTLKNADWPERQALGDFFFQHSFGRDNLHLVPVNELSLAFSPDGKWLAQVGGPADVRFCSTRTWQWEERLSTGDVPITALAFLPFSYRLAVACRDTTILIFKTPAATVVVGPELDDLDLRVAWNELLDSDAIRAYSAIRRLALSPKQAVPFLAKHLPVVPPVDVPRAKKLVAQLAGEDKEARLEARTELPKLGEGVVPWIDAALADKPTAEGGKRLAIMRERLQSSSITGETLRTRRVLEALWLMDGPEVQQLLEALAGGARGARVTEAARAALRRW